MSSAAEDISHSNVLKSEKRHFWDTRHVTSLVTPVFTQPVHAKMATVKKIQECAGRGSSVPMKSGKDIGSLPRSKFHSSVICKSSKDSHSRSERIQLTHAKPLHPFLWNKKVPQTILTSDKTA